MSEDELSKLSTNLAKELREIKRSWVPGQEEDKDKDSEKREEGRWKKKGDEVNEITTLDNMPQNDAH